MTQAMPAFGHCDAWKTLGSGGFQFWTNDDVCAYAPALRPQGPLLWQHFSGRDTKGEGLQPSNQATVHH